MATEFGVEFAPELDGEHEGAVERVLVTSGNGWSYGELR